MTDSDTALLCSPSPRRRAVAPRRLRRPALASLGLWGLLASLVACTQLEDIDRSTCGNKIIEAGEDCDGFTLVAGGICGSSDGLPEEACRQLCGADHESSEGVAAVCPDGWTCGTDGYCRQPAGSFETRDPARGIGLVNQLTVTDMDADGRDEVIAVGNAALSVVYYDEDGVEQVFEQPIVSARLAGGQMADDVPGMLAVPLSTLGALAVLQGNEDRTLDAISFAPYEAPGSGGLKLVTLEAFDDADVHSGEDTLGLQGDLLINVLTQEPVMAVDGNVEQIAEGGIVSGRFREEYPCDQVVIAYQGHDRLRLYSPCTKTDSGDYVWNTTDATAGYAPAEALPTLRLTDDNVAGGIVVAELNGDDHLDLIAFGNRGVHWAAGVGDGNFHSRIDDLPGPGELPDNQTLLLADGPDSVVPTGSLPLAVSDLNLDGQADFVFPEAVLLSTWNGLYEGIPKVGAPWISAFVGDFNANGYPDVLASNGVDASFDFFNGAGEAGLNWFTVPTNRAPRSLTVGDFDGDLLLDACFVEGDRGRDAVSVLFGQPAGPPSDPTVIGRFERVTELVTINVETLGPDATTDLYVVTEQTVVGDEAGGSSSPGDAVASSVTNVALFYGNTNRLLQAPYTLWDIRTDTNFVDPRVVTQGRFGKSGAPALTVLANVADVDSVLASETGGEAGTISTTLMLLPISEEQGAPTIASDAYRTGQTVDLDERIDADTTLLVPVDTDGDGVEELLLASADGALWGAADPVPGGLLTLFERTGDVWTQRAQRSAGEYQTVGPFLPRAYALTTTAEGAPDSTDATVDDDYRDEVLVTFAAGVSDFEGDGHPDVLLVSSRFSVERGFWRQLLLLRNDGSGELLDGELVNVTATGALADALANPATFQLLQADGDPAQEVAVATDAGIFVCDLDAAGGQLVNARRISSVTLSGVYASMTAGDFDGDGVDDLALATGDELVTLFGEAVLP